MTAVSPNEFYDEGADRTQMMFLRDSAGKVFGAVLDPGPFEQKGVLIAPSPSEW